MGTSRPPLTLPAPIPEKRFAQNGDLPSSTALRRASYAYNYANAKLRKQVFVWANNNKNTITPPFANWSELAFCFRTGHAVKKLHIVVGVSGGGASGPGSVYLEVGDYVTTIDSPVMNYPITSPGASTNPADVAYMEADITVDDGLLSDKLYTGILYQQNFARVHSVCVYEVGAEISDSDDTGVVNPLHWESPSPVYDQYALEMAQASRALWQKNGAQLFSWSHRASAVTTITSTTGQNILDLSVGSYSATAPGWRVALANQQREIPSGVDVELGLIALRQQGAGTITVDIESSSGLEMTGTFEQTGIPLTSFTGNISATDGKLDAILRVSDASTEYEIVALGLWVYS